MLSLRSFCLVLALSASTAATSFATPIVANGDFQTGSLSSWTVSGNNYAWSIAQSGSNFYASTGCVGQSCITGSSPSSLSQNLSTVAGHTYTLNFDYLAAGSPSELKVLFGSTVADDLINLSAPDTTYVVTGLVATGSVTNLNFLGRQDPSFNFLDNISVVDTTPANSPVPEPGTLGLVGTGILSLAGAARRRLLA